LSSRDSRYGPTAAPWGRPPSRPSPLASSSKRPAHQRQSFWRPWGVCPPSFPGLVTLRPSRSETLLPARHSLVIAFTPRGSRSRPVPREPLDEPENLPQEAPCQVALGKLQDEVPGMSDEAAARLEQPLLEARERPALDGDGQNQPAQQIAEV